MRAADEEAYREFVVARMDRLRRAAYLLCRDWHLADDLVSVTIDKLYRNWRRACGATSLDAYVQRILTNAWLDETRRPWRREILTDRLSEHPHHADAAYNFEYVTRLRDYHARMKPPPPSKERELPRAAPPLPTGDLPRGLTVHGRPGGPPPEMKSEEFEILTPRDLGERESDPEQAPGTRMRRKG